MINLSLDQWIAAVSGVGTLLAATATFAVVREMSRQRRASYRPEIIVSANSFDTTKKPAEVDDFYYLLGGPALRLSNTGSGAAINISVTWFFDDEGSPVRKEGPSFDYLLPASVEPEPTYIKLESGYLYDICETVGKSSFEKPQLELPSIQMEIEFADVAGTKRGTRYDVNTYVNIIAHNGFSGSFVPAKAKTYRTSTAVKIDVAQKRVTFREV